MCYKTVTVYIKSICVIECTYVSSCISLKTNSNLLCNCTCTQILRPTEKGLYSS